MVDRDKRAELSERLAALSPEKRARLRARLKTREGGPVVGPTIPRRASQGPVPLSSGQRGIWLAQQIQPTLAFNLLVSLRLVGPLDRDALTRSLAYLVERHEILRTTFEMRGDEPVQIVHEGVVPELPETDLCGVPDAERPGQLAVLSVREARRPYDLLCGPLLRAHLVRTDDAVHVLLIAVHHIAFDGWSLGILRDELVACYLALRADEEPELTPLPIQYSDFATWQQGRMGSAQLARQMEYWKEQLGGALPTLQLPTDRPRSPEREQRGARVRHRVGTELLWSLDELGRRHGATRFMLLLAALKVLLFRYGQQEDTCVGTSILGRGPAETTRLIGFFVNPLVLRSDLSGDPTFIELLGRVRTTCVEAYAHAEAPYDELVAALNPRRDPTRTSLFQVELQMLPWGEQTVEAGPLTVSIDDPEPGTVWTDLDVTAWEVGSELHIAVEYATDLFDEETAQRMLGHLGTLLGSISQNAAVPISELPILTARERRQLAEASQGISTPVPETTLEALLRAQCARRPGETAVAAGETTLTYGELGALAESVARRLSALGVGPGSVVGVCVEPTAALVVGLLGILSAGAAYLPLDPGSPEERLAFMLDDAGVDALIVGAGIETALPGEGVPRVTLLEAGKSSGSPPATGDSPRRPAPSDPAYVTYTSGSSGQPKGVVVPHSAVVNFLTSMAERPGLDERDVLLAVTTVAFDISVLELFLPLLVGARVVVAGARAAADGHHLGQLIERHGVTVMQATPTTWQLLLAAGWRGGDRLRALCGGEAWPWSLAEQLLARCESVWNLYGPTETTVWSAVQKIEPEAGAVRIGAPIANTRLLVLDASGEPTPVGVPGELFIGGAGLALGYWNRPALTAERFVRDPSAEPEARLYRTGDLVKRIADGTLEFLGRLDQQVKIRGFRVELGEIEAALLDHPAIREAAAAVREDVPGDQRLIAYVVESETVARGELRRSLSRRLPSYMVPSAYVSLTSLPLTANRKLDRAALPAPEDAAALRSADPVPPRTAMERLVADVWREVLGANRVSAQDNFFELGGHSLLAMRVVRRLREKTGARVRPRALIFQNLAEVAAACEHGVSAESAPEASGSLTQKVLAGFKRLLRGVD